MPAIQAAREAARRMGCTNNQGQVARAILNYESVTGNFPAGRIGCDTTQNIAICPDGLPVEKMTGASGFISILPQLEMQQLYDRLDVAHGGLWTKNTDDLTWLRNYPAKAEGIKARVAVYVCPSDTSEPLSEAYQGINAATASYAFVQGTVGPASTKVTALKSVAKYDNDGMFRYVTRRRAKEVTDGLSGTLMIGEVIFAHDWSSINLWTYARSYADTLRTTANPVNTQPMAGEYIDGQQNAAFASQHPTGAVFAYADGHVEFVDESIELWTYRALSTIAGEELR